MLSSLADIFLPLLVIGLFIAAAFLRIKKSLRFLQRSDLSNQEKLLHKFYILSSVALFIMAFIMLILIIVSL
jgi:hypothetical protein